MHISVELEQGLLPDRFGKHASEAYQLNDHPIRSFLIEIVDVPENVRSLALVLLDYDAVPAGYFLNKFRRAIRGHALAEVSLELPSRA